MHYETQYAAYQQAIEGYLSGLFTADTPYKKLYESIRYSLLAGGKRIRPVLTLEFARLGGIDWHLALPFACALELGSEDVLLTVRAQYIRRILDNIGSNLIKYADPARPIEVRFLRQEGRAGLVFRNHVLPAPPAVESTKVGLTSIETMMDKMHADCKIEQENEQFAMTLLFPVE